jgi:hypothetical protein
MRSFVERLSSLPEGTIFLLKKVGEEDIDFYYTLLVPDLKVHRFQEAVTSGAELKLAEFGRVLDHGAGWPTREDAVERLRAKDILCLALSE